MHDLILTGFLKYFDAMAIGMRDGGLKHLTNGQNAPRANHSKNFWFLLRLI